MLTQMRLLLTISIFIFPSICFAGRNYKTDDNKIILFHWNVNGINFETDKQKDDEIARLNLLGISTTSAVQITVPNQDVVSSTICRTTQDFDAVNNGTAQDIENVIKKEVRLLLVLKEMRNYGINKNDEIADVEGHINYLVSIWIKK